MQRGYLGVNMVGVNDEIAKKMNLSSLDGVYVDNVISGGSAEAAGLKAKDIILKINGVAVNSAPELQEQIATARPGEKVDIEYMREQKILLTKAILKNQGNNEHY
ncbi:MAG: PDZ domain-containing protein [Bacteroidetes bacterium]|nr:PDZ domain-containing protein [Bacteroidota bacterium]